MWCDVRRTYTSNKLFGPKAKLRLLNTCEYMKSYMQTAVLEMNLEASSQYCTLLLSSVLVFFYCLKAVVKIRPEKISGLYGIWSHDLCDYGAVLCQLS